MNETGGVIFKMKNDPRVTKVGRMIRRLSIDELPQLYNVFKGDMSLVGPRPHPPKEVELYTLKDRRRLEAIPGLTCFWQVSGRSCPVTGYKAGSNWLVREITAEELNKIVEKVTTKELERISA